MSSTDRKKRPDLDVIVELLGNEGFTNKELADKTDDDEPHISKYVKELRTARIVHREDDEGKLNVYIGPKEKAKTEEKLNAFRYILGSFFTESTWDAAKRLDCTRKLLASKYVNSLIAACGLIPIYEILVEYMKDEEFRNIASQTLLSQPALIDEYVKLPNLMQKYMESNPVLWVFKHSDFTKYLAVLFGFNYRASIEFHRQYLAEPFGKLYRNLTQRDLPITLDAFVTEGIRKFLEVDLFLSPLTSFPGHFPVELLFAKPFERLYTDFILCDEEDIKRLALRAHIVYSNFIGVISAGVMNLEILRTTNLEKLLKQYIFYWNVASQTLDLLYNQLKLLKIFSNDRESTIYYVYSDAIGLQIMDLDGNLLFDYGTRHYINQNSVTILDSYDPTIEIRTCDCFKDLGLETEKVSYDDLLTGVRTKLKNATTVQGDRVCDCW